MKNGYEVGTKMFTSFTQAINEAIATGAKAVTVFPENRVVWEPAPLVSKKRMARYLDQKAAHKAYKRSLAE